MALGGCRQMSKQMRGGPHFGRHFPETLNREGAEALAVSIRNYWSARDLFPKVVVQLTGEGFTSFFQVRSDMVGGQP